MSWSRYASAVDRPPILALLLVLNYEMATKDEAYANLAEQMTQLNETVTKFSRNCDSAMSLSSAAQRVTMTFDAM